MEIVTKNVVSDEKTYNWGYWKSDFHNFVDWRDTKFSDTIGKVEKRKRDI